MNRIEQRLQTVPLRQHLWVGCPRKNLWVGSSLSWRQLRGDALIRSVADVLTEIHYGPGVADVGLTRDEDGKGWWLVQFRGGKWCSWWTEDCRLLAALVQAKTGYFLLGCAVLWELDGVLQIRYVYTPSPDEAKELLLEVEQRWREAPPDRPPRFPKNSQRALVTCPHCPKKSECDALDRMTGDDKDWPMSWKVG